MRRDRVTYDRHRAQSVVVKWSVKVANEGRTGDGDSDLGIISRVTKKCLERGKASEER